MLSLNLNEDEEEEITLNQLSQDPPLSLSSSGETYLVGFILANIVGIQYYTGRISGREMVGLVREPLNPYDENAIKVLNTRGDQVGHIERAVAKTLAPLLDTHVIFVEGIVPKTPNKNARFKIPCQLHIFSALHFFPQVRSAILGGGLELMTQESAAFALSDAMVVKDMKNAKDVKTVDEIFRLVDENVGRKGEGISVKLDPPREVIVTELFEHQREGLGWLVHRESSEDLPPFWEEKDGLFVNVVTNYQTSVRPEPIKGGIFADDMGLGKTLTLLSLIAHDKVCRGNGGRVDDSICEEEGERVEDSSSSNKAKSKRGRKAKRGPTATVSNARKKKQKVVYDDDDDVGAGSESKTTLVVCTPSVFSVWVSQLCEHTHTGSLSMYMYYGGERTKDVDKLKKYDLVLTSYITLSKEDDQVDSPIKKMKWRRIILDEGHLIKNADAKQSRAVTALMGKRRWVVTGTPVQNSSCDLFSLMAFLKFDPFSNKSYWNRLIQRPLAQGDHKGLQRLQVLMSTVTLRRMKDQNLIGLPSKSIQTCYVELMQEERDLYERMEEEAKQVVKNYINRGNITHSYSTILSIILRLRQISTDVALCPHDIKSLILADSVQDVSDNPELLEKMMSLLQDAEDFDCPICISPPTDTVITCCAHIFCRSCITKTLKRTKENCPMCRRPLSLSDLYTAPPPTETTPGVSSPKLSSKVTVLLKLLSESKAKNGNVKSVVFSQFRKMLLLLEEPLKTAGFSTLRLDGTMSAKKRGQVIEAFGDSKPDSPTVLLASLKASGTGINLTAASVVYLLEPWWNPATEEQAMDRVHRIGQKRDVKIVRIIAKDTIEERVLELQEKKRELARGALGRKGSKDDKREVNVQDLCRLISLPA